MTPSTLEEHIRAIGDRLEIERELGRGSAAVVYLARDRKLDRRVAVKLLRAGITERGAEQRFHREIALLARLQHPHILQLLDSGDAGGALYYVMPYVAGLSLRQRIEVEGRLPVVDALRIGVQVANALAFAHREGVVHRDVKPENVLLPGYLADVPPNTVVTGTWHALVCDFGVARLTQRDAATGVTIGRQTATGITVGTPKYMAPEQASGERHVDGRADIFALGLMLYEMLAGELPFASASRSAWEALARRLSEPPPPLDRPDVPKAYVRRIDAVITRALAPDPDARYQTADEMVLALQGCLDVARPRAPRPERRRLALAAAAGAAAVAAAGAGAYFALAR